VRWHLDRGARKRKWHLDLDCEIGHGSVSCMASHARMMERGTVEAADPGGVDDEQALRGDADVVRR
jgi:hypothetical protein